MFMGPLFRLNARLDGAALRTRARDVGSGSSLALLWRLKMSEAVEGASIDSDEAEKLAWRCVCVYRSFIRSDDF